MCLNLLKICSSSTNVFTHIITTQPIHPTQAHIHIKNVDFFFTICLFKNRQHPFEHVWKALTYVVTHDRCRHSLNLQNQLQQMQELMETLLSKRLEHMIGELDIMQ